MEDPDRLALAVWGLTADGAGVDRRRPTGDGGLRSTVCGLPPAVCGLLAIEVIQQSIPDLSPAEWLGLCDRLALIARVLAEDAARRSLAGDPS